MDLSSIEQRLEAGENLKIKYRYPVESDGFSHGKRYGIRSDKLLDVSVELGRLYASFRGQTPVWVEIDEVIEVASDDGVYADFTEDR